MNKKKGGVGWEIIEKEKKKYYFNKKLCIIDKLI